MTHGANSEQLAGNGVERKAVGRLDSWKEIASFFRRDVRTVQLWERHERLPVHRHHHRKVGTVHAYVPELQNWWKQRCSGKAGESPSGTLEPASSQAENARPRAQIRLALHRFIAPEGFASDADRLADRIRAQLETILPPRLRVLSSFTAAQRHAEGFRREDATGLPEADYLVDASVHEVPNGLEIRLKMIRAKDRSSIWSNVCEYGNSDLLETASDLADQIARAFSHHVLVSRHSVKSRTVNPSARYAYLRGRYLWSLRSTPASLFSALEQFRLATELDPNHAPAFSGLADCYAVLGWFGAIPRETAMQEARKAAQRALSLDGSLAEAHVSMGCVHFDFDWDWRAAEREILIGIDLNPSYAQAYCWYGLLLLALGRSQEAIHAAQVAQDLDPASPTVGLILGDALFHAAEHDAAIRQFHHVLQLHPNHTMTHCRLGLAYEQAGDFRPAIAHLQFAADACANDINIQAMLAYVQARSGHRDEAMALLARVSKEENRQPIPAIDAAAAFTALGDQETAFRYLNAGFDQRNARLTALKCDPRLLPLHSDPRFESIARQMRLS